MFEIGLFFFFFWRKCLSFEHIGKRHEHDASSTQVLFAFDLLKSELELLCLRPSKVSLKRKNQLRCLLKERINYIFSTQHKI